jgi:hypothetical protein
VIDKYHEPTGHWLQTMRVDGKVVSGLVTSRYSISYRIRIKLTSGQNLARLISCRS